MNKSDHPAAALCENCGYDPSKWVTIGTIHTDRETGKETFVRATVPPQEEPDAANGERDTTDFVLDKYATDEMVAGYRPAPADKACEEPRPHMSTHCTLGTIGCRVHRITPSPTDNGRVEAARVREPLDHREADERYNKRRDEAISWFYSKAFKKGANTEQIVNDFWVMAWNAVLERLEAKYERIAAAQLSTAIDRVRKNMGPSLHDSLSFGPKHPKGSMASYVKLFEDVLRAVEGKPNEYVLHASTGPTDNDRNDPRDA